jgi:hypothetical protein
MGIGMAEMLFNTSLLALVGSGHEPHASPRKLQVLNTKVPLFWFIIDRDNPLFVN